MTDAIRYSDRRCPGQVGRRWALLGLVGLILAGPVAACGSPAEPSDEARATMKPVAVSVPPAASPTRSDRPVRPASTPQAPHPSPEPLVALATADAARQTQTGPDNVRVVQVEPREWPDRSLGCPRPGMGYAQAITPGYLIVVEADGRRLEYHTDHAVVVLCAS